MPYLNFAQITFISVTIFAIHITACSNNDNLPNTEQHNHNNFSSTLKFTPLHTFHHGEFEASAAEITDYHPATKQAFIVNAAYKRVDVLDYNKLQSPVLKKYLDISDIGKNVNSVAVHDDLVAVAVQAKVKTDNGFVAIYDAHTLERIHVIETGALPDMVTFTPNGKYILSANEGEPNDYTIDPDGSITIINITDKKHPVVTHATFTSYNDKKQTLKDSGVRIFGKRADGIESSVAQDLEPEYVTISNDSKTAYISLQENNALAVVDIASATVTSIKPFGYKNHSLVGNEIDPSNKDDKINIANFPVMGMYQPDSIASYEVDGKTYIVTANEGESREWGSFSDKTKVNMLKLDSHAFPASACGGVECTDNKALGKLKVTQSMGDIDGDGDYDVLYAYGARSFSIWDAENLSKPVYDSGSEFAKITAEKYPDTFNASHDDNSFDDRSDNKGVEPEGIALGTIGSQTIAFIGLERISSVVAYDITNPQQAKFLGEVNNRTFDSKLLNSAHKGTAHGDADGNLAPEGLHFISAKDSPNGKPLLIVGYEVSGTSVLYEITL